MASQDWPSWRGPHANGSTATGQYPTQWTPETAAWRLKLPGKGGSTPIVWKNVIYLTTPDTDQDAVWAVQLEDGKLLWQTKLGTASAPKHRNLGSSCNSSPVTDGQAIFVYYRSGRFAALELDGTVRWSQDLTAQFGPENLFWDQGSSPILTDQHVILTRMHDGDSWVAGFDKKTGKLQWRTPRNYDVPTENNNGYTTPLLFTQDGQQSILVWGADHVTAHDAQDGKLLWSCGGFNPGDTGYWPAIASPVIHDNIAIIPVGRDDRPRQARLHGIKLQGKGDVTTSNHAWQRDDVGVFVPALAEYKGRIYLLRNRGGVVCIDPKSGHTIWETELPRASGSYYASPTIANGLLYAAREDGTVFVAKIGDTFELISEIPHGQRIVASPVPVQNRILIRGDDHLFCIANN